MTTEQLTLDLGDYGWDTMPRQLESAGAGGHFRGFGKSSTVRNHAVRAATAVYDAADRAYRHRAPACERPPAGITGTTRLSPDRTAFELRQRLGLGEAEPVLNMVHVLETLGCLIAAMPPDTGNTTSFSSWVHDIPLVLLRTSGASRRRVRFDAAHELGHLMMHKGRENSDDVEKEAHAFARALLVPAPVFNAVDLKPFSWDAVRMVSERCNINLLVTLRRSQELRLISPAVYAAAMADASRRGWKARDPHDVREPEPFSIG